MTASPSSPAPSPLNPCLRHGPTTQKLFPAIVVLLLIGLHTISKSSTPAPAHRSSGGDGNNNNEGSLQGEAQRGLERVHRVPVPPSGCQEGEGDGFVIAIRIVVRAGELHNGELMRIWEKMAKHTREHEPGTIVYTLSHLVDETFFIQEDAGEDDDGDDDDGDGNRGAGGGQTYDPLHVKGSPVSQTMLFYDRYCSSYDATVIHKVNSPMHAQTKRAMEPLIIGSEPFGYTDTGLGFRFLEDGTLVRNGGGNDDDDDDNDGAEKRAGDGGTGKQRAAVRCDSKDGQPGAWLLLKQLKFAASLPESRAKEIFRHALQTVGSSFPPQIFSFEVLESNQNARDCALAVRACSVDVARAAGVLLQAAFKPHQDVLEKDREGLYKDVGREHFSYYTKPFPS